MSRFSNKVAVITGAGNGIGRALAVELADSGCNLALSDIDADTLRDTANMLDGKHGTVSRHSLDVTDRDAVAAYADQVIAVHGKVDILINNAGIAGRDVEIADYEMADYERVIDVNMWGVVNVTHAFLPHLLANPRSQIVNMSSIFGLVAFPKTGSYAISKFAVRAYSEVLRAELEPRDVSVSCVHPGVVASNLVKAANAPADVIQRFEEKGMSPQAAARKIIKGVSRRKARIRVVGHAFVIDWVQRLLPGSYRKILVPLFEAGDKP